ncbi:MAG: DoxX family protein [Thalassobius sp.]|nr:DoxX family protein [Thalassovita sp.]
MKSKILFVVCLLFGLMFINAGLNKFLNYMPMPEEMPENVMRDFNALAELSWLMPLIALGEILGGILMIIPKLRAFGAIVIFPIMMGILLFNLFEAQSGLPIAIVLFAIMTWVIIENKEKYLPMLR